MNTSQKRQAIVEALHLFAANGDVQLATLPPDIDRASELALQWDDVWVVVDKALPELFEDPEAVKAIIEINRKLDTLGDPGDQVWSDRAVLEMGAWEELRHLAREVLASLGVPRRDPPPLSH